MATSLATGAYRAKVSSYDSISMAESRAGEECPPGSWRGIWTRLLCTLSSATRSHLEGPAQQISCKSPSRPVYLRQLINDSRVAQGDALPASWWGM